MIGPTTGITRQTYDRGLEGLVAGETAISRIDGTLGQLSYRGYAIEDLAAHASFEQVAHLVLFGTIPRGDELRAWQQELAAWRTPPPAAIAALARLPRGAHPLALLRTMLTVAACHIPEVERPLYSHPARLLGWGAALSAVAVRHMTGQPPVPPRDDLGFSANFLHEAMGREASPEEVRAFDVSLIVQAEHGVHAAALAALVVISTGADLGSAVLAGMGALSGVRHGGANQLAYEMLAPLRDPDAARRWAREAVAGRHRFPGFGHRVYHCPDPRQRVLEPYAQRLLESRGRGATWQVYLALKDEIEQALGPRGIYANVDSITGLVYEPLGLPVHAIPIPFCMAIQTGWMAHCLEYAPAGRMIEPGAVYLG